MSYIWKDNCHTIWLLLKVKLKQAKGHPYHKKRDVCGSICSHSAALVVAKVFEVEDVKMKNEIQQRGVIFHGAVLSGGSYQQLPVW